MRASGIHKHRRQAMPRPTSLNGPIHHDSVLFVVSHDGVSELTLEALANAFRGGTEPREITVFLDRTAADAHHRRLVLLDRGRRLLNDLDDDRLEQVVDLLDGTQVERIFELLDRVM